MPASPNGAAARETVIPMRTANISRSTPSNHRKTWRIWSGACFAVVLLAVFVQPLLALINYAAGSQLYSYILLVPFVSAYLLYLRRDRLPTKYGADLPLAIVSLAIGLGVLVLTYWLNIAGQAPSENDRLALLTLSFLCCLVAGGFFPFRACVDASSRFSTGLPHFHGADARCDGRSARDGFQICFGRSSESSFPPQRHALSPGGPRFPTAEHHD